MSNIIFCERCGGNVVLFQDYDCQFLKCLMCGRASVSPIYVKEKNQHSKAA